MSPGTSASLPRYRRKRNRPLFISPPRTCKRCQPPSTRTFSAARRVSTWVSISHWISESVGEPIETLRIGGIGYNSVRTEPPVKIRLVVPRAVVHQPCPRYFMLRPTLRHNQSKARDSTSVTTSTIPIASRRIPTTRLRIAYILMSRYVSFPEPSPTFVLRHEGTRSRYGREPESSESGRRQYRHPHSVNGDPTNNERIPKRIGDQCKLIYPLIKDHTRCAYSARSFGPC